MFGEFFNLCTGLLSSILNFFSNFYVMLTTEYDFIGLGTFTLVDVIFVVFLITLVGRIAIAVATD